MDLYVRSPARNGSNPNIQPDWGTPSPNTALEESMCHLTISGGESYPERPGVPNCVYYMRTGFCGYGSRCRFNHPLDRAAVDAAVRATGDYPERPGEPPCQFYLKTGTCKFGASCKFNHPKHGGGSLSQAPLNSYGYPLRPGESECSYYLKTGQCKFGITCKFHHPQPAGTSLPESAPQFYQQVQSPTGPLPEQFEGASTGLRVTRPPLLPGSYVQGTYGPVLLSPGVVPFPGWSPYSAPVSPALSPGAQPAVGASSVYGVSQLSSSTSAFARPYAPLSSSTIPLGTIQKEQSFPERPGEPECQYYLRTGDCKFGLACRYHHPQDHIVTRPLLSPFGLPLRPGAQSCAFYLQNGHCKFGSTCKFDHPLGSLGYSPSASSLIDMPVTPFPVGSLLCGLSPSTSSELRHELMPGSKKESFTAMNMMPASVSLSDVQLTS